MAHRMPVGLHRAEREPWPRNSPKHLIWQLPVTVIATLAIWYVLGLLVLGFFAVLGLLV